MTRSVRLALLDDLMLGRGVCRALRHRSPEDPILTHTIDREAWQDRPLTHKMKEIFSRVWRSFL